MILKRFYIGSIEDKSFWGYTQGKKWNGWAMPLFLKEQADKVAEAFNAEGDTVTYNPQTDSFIVLLDGADEYEVFKGVEIDGTMYYPIGAGSWIWDEEYTKGEELRDFRKYMYHTVEALQDELDRHGDYNNQFDLHIELNGRRVSLEMCADLYHRLGKFIDETIEEEEQ